MLSAIKYKCLKKWTYHNRILELNVIMYAYVYIYINL